jgi:uncharacterized protein (TIGR03067 family)
MFVRHFAIVTLFVACSTGYAVGDGLPGTDEIEPISALDAIGAKADKTSNDMDSLQGTWEVVSAEFEGRPDPLPVRKHDRQIFEKDKQTITDGFSSLITRFTIDASKRPKTIDFLDFSGPHMVGKGIYLLDGDSLRLCFSLDEKGNDRPKEFKTTRGEKTVLRILKRLKK